MPPRPLKPPLKPLFHKLNSDSSVVKSETFFGFWLLWLLIFSALCLLVLCLSVLVFRLFVARFIEQTKTTTKCYGPLALLYTLHSTKQLISPVNENESETNRWWLGRRRQSCIINCSLLLALIDKLYFQYFKFRSVFLPVFLLSNDFTLAAAFQLDFATHRAELIDLHIYYLSVCVCLCFTDWLWCPLEDDDDGDEKDWNGNDDDDDEDDRDGDEAFYSLPFITSTPLQYKMYLVYPKSRERERVTERYKVLFVFSPSLSLSLSVCKLPARPIRRLKKRACLLATSSSVTH